VSTTLHRLRYEMRVLGFGALALPLLVVAVFLGFSLLAAYDVSQTGGTDTRIHHDVALGLLFLIEFGLPPVAGFIAAYLVAANPAKELHMALPARYAGVMRGRLVLFTLWAMLVCAGVTAAVDAAGYWIAPQSAPLYHLTWLAPLLWFVATGALLALLLGNWVASTAILGMLWVGLLFLRWYFLQDAVLQKLYLFLTLSTVPGADAPDAPYWLGNRLILIGMGVVFLALAALLLRRSEAILGN
jgi:hypothetical protein